MQERFLNILLATHTRKENYRLRLAVDTGGKTWLALALQCHSFNRRVRGLQIMKNILLQVNNAKLAWQCEHDHIILRGYKPVRSQHLCFKPLNSDVTAIKPAALFLVAQNNCWDGRIFIILCGLLDRRISKQQDNCNLL